MNTRPKIPANARNLNAASWSSGSGKTRFWLTRSSFKPIPRTVVVILKGRHPRPVRAVPAKENRKVRVFNSIDFSKSMHYNPLAYI